MSTMLEQAIIDAKSLREAAVKNAESAIVEKYSTEVKQAVETLLEAEEDIFGNSGEGAPSGVAGGETADDSTAMEQVPMAHLVDEEEEVVVVDLDDIIAAAEVEEDDEEELELDREEIADEVGIDLESDTDTAPANRDDDLEINESELVNMFKEMLTVDVSPVEVQHSEEEVEEEDHEERQEREFVQTDGMDEEDIEEYYRTMAKFENLQRENKKLKKIIHTIKEKLQETNLANARLLYTNRVLSTASLNEQQKNKIVEMVQNSRSVQEAKMVYETLQKTMAADTSVSRSQSLSEAVSKSSSVILGSRRAEPAMTEQNPTITRWATLAGLKDK